MKTVGPAALRGVHMMESQRIVGSLLGGRGRERGATCRHMAHQRTGFEPDRSGIQHRQPTEAEERLESPQGEAVS